MTLNPLKNQIAIPDVANFDRENALRGLGSDEKQVVLAALTQIAHAGTVKMMTLKLDTRIASLMGHQDPEVAAMAAMTLGTMGKGAAKYAQYFVMMLANPSEVIKIAALEALGSVGHTGQQEFSNAVVSLAVNGDTSAVRVAAISALGAMEATEQWDTLSKMLKDSSPKLRAASIEAVGRLVSKSLEVESMFPKDEQVKTYKEALADWRTRQSALNSLIYLGAKAPTGVFSAVVDSLSDKDISTRQAAVAAITSMASAMKDESMDGLKSLLKNTDAGVRAAAASALGPLGKCSEAVSELLTDDAEDHSGLALQIGNGAKRAIPQLRLPKCAALSALGLMGDGAYTEKISAMHTDANWEVRLCVAEVLGIMGDKAASEADALKGLLSDDMYPVRAMACWALGQVKNENHLPSLVEALEDDAPSVRKFALTAIGEIGPAANEYCHDIFKCLEDPVPYIRGAAAVTLSKMGETGSQYAGAVVTQLYSEDAELRASVLEALGGMGEPAAIFAGELYDFCMDPVPAVQQAAVKALDALGGHVPVFVKDSGDGPGIPVDEPVSGDFKGLGLYYAEVKKGKEQLVAAGKWPESIF